MLVQEVAVGGEGGGIAFAELPPGGVGRERRIADGTGHVLGRGELVGIEQLSQLRHAVDRGGLPPQRHGKASSWRPIEKQGDCAEATAGRRWQRRLSGETPNSMVRVRQQGPIVGRTRAMFDGSIVALVTPFRNGGIDERAFQDLVEWHVREGTDGLVPVGTTGESPTLSHAEHERVVELCVEASGRRLPVIAGTGSNSTEEAISLTRHAKEVERRRRLDRDALLQQADAGGSLSSITGPSTTRSSCRSSSTTSPAARSST